MRYLVCLAILTLSRVNAQNIYVNPHTGFDVQHYKFEITVSDKNDQIRGTATVQLLATADSLRTVTLDLEQPDKEGGLGMTVSAVSMGREILEFRHTKDILYITLPEPLLTNNFAALTIKYTGTPANGLIVSRNKHGDRTFFGDNWPNRARCWLPVVDYLNDKATCEWLITAPSQYKVIANGYLEDETKQRNGNTLTHWRETVPIATKVMVFAAARFCVRDNGTLGTIPVQTWVYPQDSAAAMIDYAPGIDILSYFYRKIGTYSYEKLANVQSTTMFGGMENASCIFYNENIVHGTENDEMLSLLAHEIAHQWFGNAVSEQNFAHIWLSEGFATYLSAHYMGVWRGPKAFQKIMNDNRQQVISFARGHPNTPVIDSTQTNLMSLLNANSYQKGGWVLHMLHQEIGDSLFWATLGSYYTTYRNQNANTAQFQAIAEKISGKSLDTFFKQWLYQPGIPEVTQKIVEQNGKWFVRFEQTQRGNTYQLPITIAITDKKGTEIQRINIRMTDRNQQFELPAKPERIVADPDCQLLWQLSL